MNLTNFNSARKRLAAGRFEVSGKLQFTGATAAGALDEPHWPRRLRGTKK